MPELCEVCKGKGQKVLAAVICTDCRQFYCSACRDVHRMFRSTKDHKYVELVAELFDEKPKADDKPKPLPAVNRQSENDAIHGKTLQGFLMSALQQILLCIKWKVQSSKLYGEPRS